MNKYFAFDLDRKKIVTWVAESGKKDIYQTLGRDIRTMWKFLKEQKQSGHRVELSFEIRGQGGFIYDSLIDFVDDIKVANPSKTTWIYRTAKKNGRKNAIVAADLLNDRVLPFYEEHDVPLLRILTDRGTEYCGKYEQYEYELYLAVEDIDHSKTKTKSPQSNGICERFHKTLLDEFYRVAFRKKIYNSLDELRADLDTWMKEYNEQWVHSGKYCFGKKPMQTFLDSMPLVKEKMLNKNLQAEVSCLSD